MIVITGATGNIGSKLANILLASGEKIRVVGRSADKLKVFADKGAEIAIGDILDSAFLTTAFTGAKSVFAMIPPDMQTPDAIGRYEKISESLTTAIQKADVKYVVALSSVGAHLSENNGMIKGLHIFEQKLKAIPNTHLMILRPTFFMENLYGNIGMIKNMGILGSPTLPELPFSMVATKDIAVEAAKHLSKLDFDGHNVRYLLGPEDHTYQSVTRIVGEAIGKPELQYVQFPYADATQAMVGMGMSTSVAENLVTFLKANNEGYIASDVTRNSHSTTPTKLQEFVQEWAVAYQNN